MKYYVHIDRVYLYGGSSHRIAVEMLQTAINVMRQVKGTGVVYYANADSTGQYPFVDGAEINFRSVTYTEAAR